MWLIARSVWALPARTQPAPGTHTHRLSSGEVASPLPRRVQSAGSPLMKKSRLLMKKSRPLMKKSRPLVKKCRPLMKICRLLMKKSRPLVKHPQVDKWVRGWVLLKSVQPAPIFALTVSDLNCWVSGVRVDFRFFSVYRCRLHPVCPPTSVKMIRAAGR